VLIESVFAIPGVGELLVQSVLSKDFPVVQGVTTVLMFSVILINLVVDVLVAAIDPRTRQ
jgi:ABC-type dipeptide/oligopeptide/nickel transport system permease component